MHDIVSRLAGVLTSHGVKKGDRVIIYMPMIAEAIFAMLACARIAAIHSVVFGGFAAAELASRIRDCDPKILITASCGIEPHKKINYKTIVDEAIKISGADKMQVLLKQRPELICSMVEGRDFDYEEELKKGQHTDCTFVNGDHPLYILYTSGTTGMPKGIVRDHGGTAVALAWTMKYIMGINPGDMYFAGSDIGWVVGHSFIVYGPLVAGSGTVVFEGKPITCPDAGAYWRLVEEHKINGVYSSPTGLRCIRRDDPEGEFVKKYDISSLQNISMAGERFDIHTFKWLQEMVPESVLINDNYWQTESGWPISCNYKDLYQFPVKAGSCTMPAPGYDVYVLDKDNKPLP